LSAIPFASAIGTGCAIAALVAVACGGSTGREGLVDPALMQQQQAGDDATMAPFDAGLFDVVITYADRDLPEITAPPEAGGAEAGYPWPDCPPFLNVYPAGGPATPGMEIDQAPSEFAADGTIVAAPDGSACATYGWLGSTAIDECLTSTSAGVIPGTDYTLLPPCNWVADAGTARGGPRMGDPRYAICLDLYACVMKTGCGAVASAPEDCLCGLNSAQCDAGGPCASQELGALEYSNNTDGVLMATKDFFNSDPGFAGLGGSMLNSIFQFARSNGCFPADGGSGL
jgi:hypothetical protein